MQLFFLLLLPWLASAADNAVRFIGAGETNQPFTIPRWFKRGEIANYPRPYVDGSAVDYQTDVRNRWDDGSVKFALISFRSTLPSGTMVVDFRNATDPCTGGASVSACRGLGLTTATALTYNSSGWDARIKLKPYPQGSNSEETVSARTMLTDGRCRAVLQGPIVTEFICNGWTETGGGFYDGDDFQADEAYAVGWYRKWFKRGTLNSGVDANRLYADLYDVTGLDSLARPFQMRWIGDNDQTTNELVYVCYVDTSLKRIYFGNSNGSDSSCQNASGRPSPKSVEYPRWFMLVDTMYATGNNSTNDTTIEVNDTTGLVAGDLVWGMHELMRVSGGITATSFEVGHARATVPNAYGRRYGWSNSSRLGTYSISTNMPIYRLDKTDTWVTPSSATVKPISPEFHLRFYTGQAGVGVKFFVRNWNYTKLMSQLIDYSFENCTAAGSGCTTVDSGTAVMLAPSTGFKHPRTRTAMRRAWTANAPTYNTDPDHGIQYLYDAGLISMDPNIAVPSTYAAAATDTFANGNYNQKGWTHADNTQCAPPMIGNFIRYDYHAQMGTWQTDIGASAARPDIGGPHPLWYTMPLYAAGSSVVSASDKTLIWDVFWGQAACAEYFPVHQREGTDGGTAKHCDGGTSTQDTAKACPSFTTMLAGGHPVTRIGRASTTLRTREYENQNSIGWFTLGAAAPSLSDVFSHLGDLSFLPYYLSGDWEFYQEHQYSTYWGMMQSTYGNGKQVTDSTGERQRVDMGDWYLPWWCNGSRCISRVTGWLLRNQVMMIDGTPEAEFFTHYANLWRTVHEGLYNITTGAWYRTCSGGDNHSSYWCFGRQYWGLESPNGTSVAYPWHVVNTGSGSEGDVTLTYKTDAPWMRNYGAMEIGEAIRMGHTSWLPVYDMITKGARAAMTNPAVVNRYLNGTYRQPITPCLPEGTPQPGGCASQTYTLGGQIGFTSIVNYGLAHSSGDRALTNYGSGFEYGGYGRISQAALFMAPALDTTEARDAWRWVSKQSTADEAKNPGMFCKEYPANIQVTVHSVTATTATMNVKADVPPRRGWGTCQYTLSTGGYPASTLMTGWTAISNFSGDTNVSLTGLSSGTTYYPVIDCGYRRVYAASFTTQ